VKALRARFDAMLRERGLRLGQYQMLVVLWRQDGLTPRELAERTAVEMPTVTRTVQRMLRDGLVRRQANPLDARSVLIHLAPKGRALEAVSLELRRAFLQTMFAGIGEAERSQLVATLNRVLENAAG
jgi:DNA-binding MarR family transcriptional regulator